MGSCSAPTPGFLWFLPLAPCAPLPQVSLPPLPASAVPPFALSGPEAAPAPLGSGFWSCWGDGGQGCSQEGLWLSTGPDSEDPDSSGASPVGLLPSASPTGCLSGCVYRGWIGSGRGKGDAWPVCVR